MTNRHNQHRCDAFTRESSSLFHRAIRKYGFENWTCNILYISSDEEDVYQAEKQLIEDYNTFNKGYNLTEGGSGLGSGEAHPCYGIRGESHWAFGKIGPNKGKKTSEETKRKQSLAKRGKNHPNYGKHLSEETKKKIGLANKGKSSYRKGKKCSEDQKLKISAKNKNTLPWNTSTVKTKIHIRKLWAELDLIYNCWIGRDMPGHTNLEKYYLKTHMKQTATFRNMVKWFRKNGNPKNCSRWVEFKSTFSNS